jgi:sigma-B regulation protein RsbU (phosphoserine phosphatase)
MLYHAEAMILADTQLTANEVLRVFHRDEPYLFLGASFTTVGAMSIAFGAIRKRFDPLLVSLAIFAILYGQRLWMDAGLLRLTIPPSDFFDRLSDIVDFLVPIPALWFFHAVGFLDRFGKPITVVMTALFSALVVATAVFGVHQLFHSINNLGVVVLILTMMILLLRRRADRDFAVLRVGLLTFGILAIYDNLIGRYKIEPYGFAVLLASLGYVAARRTLQRDEELGEIQRELELARRIQHSLLPAAFPESRSFRVAARYVPMNSVAGDFYDFLVADPAHAGLFIADVSGHGVPAALIASMVKMAAVSQRSEAPHPARLLTGMNRALCGNTQGQYVTAAYVYLDAAGRELRYAAAGHPAMLLLRRGSVIEVAENGLLLAAIDNISYSERVVAIEPGDRLLLYTDGVIEARNPAGELFGDERVTTALKQSAGSSPHDAANAIVASVKQWSPSQDDDLTILICDCQGI